MLIAEHGSRTRVSGTRHELSGRRTPCRRPRGAGTPQVMKVDLGTPQIRTERKASITQMEYIRLAIIE